MHPVFDTSQANAHTFAIAPMMAYTCPHGRYLMRLLAPNVRLYSEMIVDQALVNGNPAALLKHDPSEYPLAIQLAAARPEGLAQAIRRLFTFTDTAAIAEINLNLGCPSSRVQSGGFGVCQIKDPILCHDLVAAMAETAQTPISVKTRLGVDDVGGENYILDLFDGMHRAGCEHFILHARHAWLDGLDPKQNRNIPPLNYACVYRLKQHRQHWRVILNGGLQNMQHCLDALQHTDGIMIGRAAFGDPWLIARLQAHLFATPGINATELLLCLYDYWCRQHKQGERTMPLLRAAMHLFQNRPGAKVWRQAIAEQQCNQHPDFDWLLKISQRFTADAQMIL